VRGTMAVVGRCGRTRNQPSEVAQGSSPILTCLPTLRHINRIRTGTSGAVRKPACSVAQLKLTPDISSLQASPANLVLACLSWSSSGQLFEREQPFCVDQITALPNSHRGFLRLADAARCAGQHKPAMLSYASAFQRTGESQVQDYCVKKLVDCSKDTEWGALFLGSELSQVPGTIASMLLEPWSEGLRSVIEELGVVPSLCFDPRDRLFTPAKPGAETNAKLP
jgi:hypothetical protein